MAEAFRRATSCNTKREVSVKFACLKIDHLYRCHHSWYLYALINDSHTQTHAHTVDVYRCDFYLFHYYLSLLNANQKNMNSLTRNQQDTKDRHPVCREASRDSLSCASANQRSANGMVVDKTRIQRTEVIMVISYANWWFSFSSCYMR